MVGLVAINPEPQGRGVQSTLKAALAEAKTGDVSAVAVCIVHRDGAVSQSWSELPSVPAMLGSVSQLLHRLNLELDER